MKKALLITGLLIALAFNQAQAADGMINVKSTHSVENTATRLENILNNKGMTVFNRIKHSDGAKRVGLALRDTQVIVFGNPKVGSPLMQCQQSIAIDLPQKALIWENEAKEVFISYNDPNYLKARHKVEGCDAVFGKISKALGGLTKAAANK